MFQDVSAAGGRGDETWCVPAYLPDNSKCVCQWQERTKRRARCATPVGVESCRCARDKRIQREAFLSREGSIWSSASTRGGASVGLPFRFSGEHEMHATLKPVIGHQAESAHREITWAWNPASGETRCWAQVTRSDLRVQGPNVRTTSKEFLVRTPSKGTFQPIGARMDPAAPGRQTSASAGSWTHSDQRVACGSWCSVVMPSITLEQSRYHLDPCDFQDRRAHP